MSFGELLFLSVLALLVFGPRRLPEIARTAARLMSELRRASNEFRYSLEDEVRMLDLKEQAQRQAVAPPPQPVPGTAPRSLAAPPLPPPPASDPPALPVEPGTRL